MGQILKPGTVDGPDIFNSLFKTFFLGSKATVFEKLQSLVEIASCEKKLICDRYPIGAAHVQLSTEVRRKRDGSPINYFNHQLWEENVFKRVID